MIVIALGSNLPGHFGAPVRAFRRAIRELAAAGIRIVKTSEIYVTEAYAYTPQPDYINAIAIATTPLPPDALLQVLKRIEAQAGRHISKGVRTRHLQWIPRPLDLDIVGYKGIVRNWEAGLPKAGGRVILPHPRAHERAFVLLPLAEVAPYWHHPVFGLTAPALLKVPGVRETGRIVGRIKFWE